MQRKTTQEFTIVEDFEFMDVDAQNIQSFIKKYSKDFHVDFQKDISLSVNVKYNDKIQGCIMKIVVKDSDRDEYDPLQEKIDFSKSKTA